MTVVALLISVILILTSLAVYVTWRRLNYWKRQGIPHDEPHWLHGNMQGIMKTRAFTDFDKEVYFKYRGTGPFCGLYFFQRPAVMVLEPALTKNVLIKDSANFVSRGLFHNEKDDPLTGNLFRLDGEKWRILRNKLSPTFTSGKMKFMFPTVVQVAEKFVATLREMLTKDDIVEIKELLARYTTDVIGTCAFGIDCNSLEDPNAEFRVMGRRVFTGRRHGAFVSGLIQSFPEVARKLHTRIIAEDVNDFFMRIVRETVAYREANNVQRNDFLNLLMDLNKGKILGGENEALRGLSVEEMAAQTFVFFVGGFETSSSTMGFCLYELAQHQDIQQRMRDEINETLKKHNNELTYECLKDMQYMKQVIAETLRKYPILPHLSRQALNDYPVPGHPRYVIPKGTFVLIPVAGMHHDPDIYPEPEKFDPERFAPEKVKERDSICWLAFGDGPRNCIGLRFGQMQMRVGLALLLKNFKLSVCAQTEFPLEINPKTFVQNTKNGIFLKVEPVLTATTPKPFQTSARFF